MNGSWPEGTLSSRPCPPYRGVVVVDAEAFSRADSASMPDLSADILAVLEASFRRCGLESIWENRRFPDGTGDGVVFGARAEDVPFLVYPWLDSLQESLEEHDRVLRLRNRALRLRLRVSIHVGPVPDSGIPVQDRISTPTIDTFRIVDAPAVKQRLKDADPDVTMVIAVLSQRVFEDMVLGGYTGIHPSRLTEVNADLAGKGFTQPAWVYVPRPSHGATARDSTSPVGDGAPQPRPAIGDEAAGSRVRAVIHGSVENVVTAGRVEGGITMTGRKPDVEGMTS